MIPDARILALFVSLLASGQVHSASALSASAGEWPAYGGSAAGDRYSTLTQVDRHTVGNLAEVWRYETGEGGLQTSPLMVNGLLYGMSPGQNVFALDAASGKLLWQHDQGDVGQQPVRGLAYWSNGSDKRLLTSSGTYLIALDAVTGKPVKTFGRDGRVDLRQGLRGDGHSGATFLTSPGVVYHDLIITGFRTTETPPAASGAVRAYDVRTGKLRWIFHLIPRGGESGAESWPEGAWKTAGGANAWAGMTVDEARGIVYVPTGSAVPDFYGADRKGDNLFANSLVALDALTGKYLWHFQGVHHDIWDRDFPSPPVLLTVRHGNETVDAVAQPTKQGFLFLFNRVTGAPLFPIEERQVPPSDVPGEAASSTQPVPVRPAPYARQMLTPELLTNRTPEARAAALREFESLRSGGQFLPLAVGRQTVVFPGFDGGAEWGGPGVDRERGVLYINSTDIAWTGGLAETAARDAQGLGATVYQQQCAVCHGLERQGVPPDFPRLQDVGSRMLEWEIARVINGGKGRMPGFPQLAGAPMQALVDYLRGAAGATRELPVAKEPDSRTTYSFTGYRKFLDAEGYPAVLPPWGTLNAIDMNTGEYLWKVPLGRYPALSAAGVPDTGTENYGGPIVTAGGLVFIGATVYDRKFRAFDSGSGKLLWEADLPYAGVATPITYEKDGRQYVVIATSGQRDAKGPQGSAYVAFALPNP